jgi:hypothetical protein
MMNLFRTSQLISSSVPSDFLADYYSIKLIIKHFFSPHLRVLLFWRPRAMPALVFATKSLVF